MTRLKSFVQALIGVGLLLGLTILLIGLFASANKPQPGSRVQQTGVPTAAATAIFTPEPPQVQPTLPPVATRALGPRPAGILYESAGELSGELYWQAVDEQGKAIASAARVPIDLTPGSKIGKLFPAPDGSQVVYEVESLPPEGCCELDVSLYIFSPPNGQPRQILSAEFYPGKIFGWHPNSRQLVYWTENGIGLFDVQSSEKTLVARPEEWANLPYDPQVDGVAFSPDGKQLIVSYTLTGQSWDIWILNADGSEPKLLFQADYPVFAFAWSPDGRYIAFVGQGLEVMTPDGQDRKILSRDFSVGWRFEPVWSPDSRLIAFTAAEIFPDDLFKGHKVRLADPLTGKEQNLLPDATGGEVEPGWSPDGKWIMFLSNRSGASEIWMVSSDGTQLEQLTSDAQPKRWAPVWLPASER